jgi:hypothetical protein
MCANCCNQLIKLSSEEKLLLIGKQLYWFLAEKLTPGEDSVYIAEMTTKKLEYHINLVGKAAEEFERIVINFERNFTVD